VISPTAVVLLSAGLFAAPPGAVRRGNAAALDPYPEGMVWSVAAAARAGVLVGSGSGAVQPGGFGFAAQIGAYFTRIDRVRLGLAFHGGHMRFPEKRRYRVIDPAIGETDLERWANLSHTDLSLGPAFEIPAGPLLVFGSVTPGFGLSNYQEPRAGDPYQTRNRTSADFMLRGGGGLAIPLIRNQGISIGAAAHQYFSPMRLTIDADPVTGEGGQRIAPFDTVLELHLGYQAWF